MSWIGKSAVHGTGSILLPVNRKTQKFITERKRKAGRRKTVMRFLFFHKCGNAKNPAHRPDFWYSGILACVLHGCRALLAFTLSHELLDRFIILGLHLSLRSGFYVLWIYRVYNQPTFAFVLDDLSLESLAGLSIVIAMSVISSPAACASSSACANDSTINAGNTSICCSCCGCSSCMGSASATIFTANNASCTGYRLRVRLITMISLCKRLPAGSLQNSKVGLS